MSLNISKYRIANWIAPDRASQGDHYDMKIDAIIAGLESGTKAISGVSDGVTNSVAKTYFNKTLTIPALTLRPGNFLTVKALLTASSPAANATTLAVTLEMTTTPAALTLYTVNAFNPGDGFTSYLLEYRAFITSSGQHLVQIGDRWYDFAANAATIINPDSTLQQFAPGIDNILKVSAEWSAADANSVVLDTFSYNIT